MSQPAPGKYRVRVSAFMTLPEIVEALRCAIDNGDREDLDEDLASELERIAKFVRRQVTEQKPTKA